MTTFRFMAPGLLVSFLALGGSLAAQVPKPVQDKDPLTTIATGWKVGSWWDIQIDLADKSSFVLHAFVSGEETKGVPAWQLTFLPGDNAPGPLKGLRHRVLVDKKTARLLHAYRHTDKKPIDMEALGHDTFITGAPEGFPLEWLLGADIALKSERLSRRITVRHERGADHVVIEMALTNEGAEVLKVRQKWFDGENWWAEHERFVQGRKELHARTLNRPAQFDQKKIAAPPGAKGFDPKRFSLRSDPRLQAPVKLIEVDPPLANFLDRLQAATGLRFSLADNLTDHVPRFGSVQYQKAPAWSAMEMLAEKDLRDGRGEKTGDGYRLTGTSLALAPPGGSRYVLGFVISMGVALAGIGALVMRRRYRQRVQPFSGSPNPKTAASH